MREDTEFGGGGGGKRGKIYHKSVLESALSKIVFNIKKHISLHNLSHFFYKKTQTSKRRHKAKNLSCNLYALIGYAS